ncbi:hypothetical protein ABIA06_003148 [Bradyrhizobium yuanmingense]|uniref:hypothetical protein n=1 Tax=Bradyrhizobium yuanmingense TaxID=108015 RepID=UPI0035168F3E
MIVLNLALAALTTISALGGASNSERFRYPQLVQADPTTDALRNKLQQQNAVENRLRTVVPPGRTQNTDMNQAVNPLTSTSDADKIGRVQRMIEEMERRKGAETGTVRVHPSTGGAVRLEFDVKKMNRNFTAGVEVPMGNTIAMPPDPAIDAVIAPADVEYRVNSDHASEEQVVAVKRNSEVLATAFRSGEQPVSLDVKTANLTARQIAGPAGELAVAVTVGAETRELTPGTSSQFGNIEVSIQTSSNRSNTKQYNEGPAYALRLQVRSIK